MSSRLRNWASFIKVEHTLFSLPVMFAGTFLAARQTPEPQLLLWVLLAGVGARTLAMALNRLIDRHADAANPRTADRELPVGKMTVGEGWGIAAGGLAIYAWSCSNLPPICQQLAPVPVLVFVAYPYLKRFTPLAHLGIGLALALAPLGGWVAVRGDLVNITPAILLSAFTLLWVAGFDIIYATLDEDSDRATGIRSMPAWLGTATALRVSMAFHAVAVVALGTLYAMFLDGLFAGVAVVLVAVLLFLEQRLAHRVNFAFFQINIVVGFAVLGVVLLGIQGL
ncbi:MAG: 4-hydroxybenzoate octaprenyltransferase [Acidobacteria bacterium]|nr:4-hydroxybenzoate octaprenyltransferase [Acidobacteriota bacterium]